MTVTEALTPDVLDRIRASRSVRQAIDRWAR